MITVTGVLIDPMGKPLYKSTIKIQATKTNKTLLGSTGKIVTDDTGAYNFNLVQGAYRLEAMYTDQYYSGGIVTITGSTATPLTLPALFNLAVPE